MQERTRRKRLLQMMSGGAPAVILPSVYIFQVEFSSASGAPITSPYVGENGSLAKSDSGDKSTVSGGSMIWTSSTSNFNPAWTGTALLTRKAGRALVGKLTEVANRAQIGMANSTSTTVSATRRGAFDFNGTSLLLVDNNFNAVGTMPVVIASGVAYRPAVVQHGATLGNYYFIKGGAFTAWRLLFVDLQADDGATGKAPFITALSTTSSFTFDYIHVADYGGIAYENDYGLATLNQTSGLTSGAVFTGNADGNHILNFSLPGTPVAGDKVELRFNINASTPTQDYNTAYLIRNAGNTDWDFRMDSVAAGVPTQMFAPVTSIGAQTQIQVSSFGSARYAYSGPVWTNRGGAASVSNQNTSTGVAAVFSAGQFVPSRLLSFPATSATYEALDTLNT